MWARWAQGHPWLVYRVTEGRGSVAQVLFSGRELYFGERCHCWSQSRWRRDDLLQTCRCMVGLGEEYIFNQDMTVQVGCKIC